MNHCLFHFFIDLYHLQMMNSKIWSTKIICIAARWWWKNNNQFRLFGLIWAANIYLNTKLWHFMGYCNCGRKGYLCPAPIFYHITNWAIQLACFYQHKKGNFQFCSPEVTLLPKPATANNYFHNSPWFSKEENKSLKRKNHAKSAQWLIALNASFFKTVCFLIAKSNWLLHFN